MRFALSQLSGANAHHEFEHLCRQLCRQTIVSNVIPATGPVSAYGDQGRDFETFPVYIKSVGLADRSFVGLATDKRVAFACTLQKRSLERKVLSDVEKITGGEVRFDAVHVFTEANVASGLRNRIRDAVRSRFGVDLVLYDGNAIAESLSDPDVIWIAEEYLHLPSEVVPAPSSHDSSSYEEIRGRWRASDSPPGTFGEFSELRRMIRVATFDEAHRADLPFWIAKAESMRQVAVPVIGRKLDYEIAVASLRGMGTLSGQEARLRSYFSSVQLLTSVTDLVDAQVLLMYVFGDLGNEPLHYSSAEAKGWHNNLVDRIEALMPETGRQGAAMLYQSLGALRLISPWDEGTDGGLRESSADSALDAWGEAVSLAEETPLFPIDDLADLVSLASPMLADRPAYEELTGKLDALVEQRGGKSHAAAKCRDRAMALYHAGNLIAAIRELHNARIDWFAGDTLRGSLLALGITAHCYDQLGLHAAAKYYWLSLAYLAEQSGAQSTIDLAPAALLRAAQSDYSQGAFVGFTELAAAALEYHAIVDENPWDFEQDEDLTHTWFALAVTLAVARRHDPPLAKELEGTLESFGLLEETERQLSAEAASWLTQVADAELARKIEGELGAAALADCGPTRTLAFRALGLTWSIQFANTYETSVAAERFAAFVQIVAVELANSDLCLMPTEIQMRAELAVDDSWAEPRPSNDGRYWDVRLLPDVLLDASVPPFVGTLAIVLTVLADVSLLPTSEFTDRFHEAMEQRLAAKLVPGVLFDEALRFFVPLDSFHADIRRRGTPFASGDRVVLEEDAALAWIDTPGPGYSKEKANEFLTNRYDRLRRALRHSFPRLLQNGKVRSVFASLRREGWLDWRIMNAAHTIVLNWRMRLTGGLPESQADFERIAREVGFDDDELAATIPPSEISIEAMREADTYNSGAALKTWGLEPHQRTPDMPAIRVFLDRRFGHSTDDIPHPDPLDPKTWEAPQ